MNAQRRAERLARKLFSAVEAVGVFMERADCILAVVKTPAVTTGYVIAWQSDDKSDPRHTGYISVSDRITWTVPLSPVKPSIFGVWRRRKARSAAGLDEYAMYWADR